MDLFNCQVNWKSGAEGSRMQEGKMVVGCLEKRFCQTKRTIIWPKDLLLSYPTLNQ